MKLSTFLVRPKQTATFMVKGLMRASISMGLVLTVAQSSAFAQDSDFAVPVNTSASTSPSPADWTGFHRDNMQRWNSYEAALGINNVGRLNLKWKYPGFYLRFDLSSPAIVNGVVYFGSDDNKVYALNANTGAKLWSFTTGNTVRSSPAVANGIVYIGSDDNNLYALDANTGAKLWSYSTGNLVFSSPTVAGGIVYIISADGYLYALDANTGVKLWSDPRGGGGSSPAVVDGVVYVASEFDVYALNAKSGAQLWSDSVLSTSGSSSPAVVNGVVYVGSGDGNLYALNASTGAKLWAFTTGGLDFNSPAVANGVVYIGSIDGNLYALNAGTGKKMWSYSTKNIVETSPAVANGVVYFASFDGNLYALNASTGEKLWSYAITAFENFPEQSSPSIVDGTVYIRGGDLSGNGNVYAFGLNVAADLQLRISPTPTVVAQGDLLTYAFPIWNLGPSSAVHEVLTTGVPAGTTFDYIRISGTPGLGTCTTPPYQGTGQIVCHENASMAPNTTWTVRLTVKVTAPRGSVITENASTMADTPDPNLANNTATMSVQVQ